MWKLHRQNRSRPQGRMPNEALMCPKGQSSEKYAARWASKRYDRMADWGFRSPSVHKSVPGVAETPHTRSQDDYGQLGRYPLDKPQGSIAPFTGYHPISLLFIYEFVDWWDGMSCIVITCLVQWLCADVLAWAGFREMWWWPASESNWRKFIIFYKSCVLWSKFIILL